MNIDNQHKVDLLLNRGIIFSVLWLGGIGSLIAVISATKAYNIIHESNDNLTGKGKVWFCFILGGIGIIFWFPIIFIGIINNFIK